MRGVVVKQNIAAGLTIAVFVGLSAAAQDWYQDRDVRYEGQRWRSQVFLQVRSDLDHIWSARGASEKERTRLDRTKQELTELQAKLDRGQFDNGILNDVIDSIENSSNEDTLAPRDRAAVSDELNRLKDYQNNHNHWAQENHNHSAPDWYRDRDVRYEGQRCRSEVLS